MTGLTSKGEGALNALGNLESAMRLGVAQAAEMAGQVLVRQAQAGITSGAHSGRIYGGHQASAPGEYSANETGDLVGSIDYSVAGAERIEFYADSDHAGYQEYGTSKMAARPNLSNAIRDTEGEVSNIIDQIVWRALAV